MRTVIESAVVERVEDGEKEKKKKRRPNRRSKQNPPSISASYSAVNEIRGEAAESVGSAKTTNNATTSLKQQKLEAHPQNDNILMNASNVAFKSLPTMHINEQASPEDVQILQNRNPQSSEPGGRILSKSCPEPISCEESSESFMNKDFSTHQMESCAQKKYFAPHWSLNAVNDAIERGEAFKALFHVNAYNRLEAYCKIDGVPIDVFISGIASQNRAVEGDIVAVKVDSVAFWTRMKGSTGMCSNSALVEDLSLLPEDTEVTGDNYKGKGKVGLDHDDANHTGYSFPDKELHCEESASLGETSRPDLVLPSDYGHVDGRQSTSDYSNVGSSSGLNDVKNAVGRMCAMLNSFPNKQPTGRVLAVIERSPRRDAVVGFLNVKQWLNYRELCRKDAKKSKTRFSFAEHGYIQLTPIDPRFPKMMILVSGLPDCLKKRLENSDATLDMELVAARIDSWDEASAVPQACILHTFGQGGKLETQLDAILFENAICTSDFSSESLTCLPSLPWEVPQEEFRSRMDLRKLCIFSIDPSTATDLDDALSIEVVSNGIFRVGVHIADVSYFVLPDTELDKEAQIRSTSVHMLQKKLPMLPPLLSENIGSLNPGVDRLAFSIFLDINPAGDITDQWIGRTVIRSCCKLSYELAQDIIDGLIDVENIDIVGNGSPQIHGHFEWHDVISSVKNLHEVSKILKEKRLRDGALRLESSKVAFVFDGYGEICDIKLSERSESNFLVEEFMLLANKTAAEVISRAFPDSALLRRHPEPNMRKLREFEAFCKKHGFQLDTSSSGQIHQSLERIRTKLKDDSIFLDILMNNASKPMQLATYFCSGELKDWGHYSLAVPLYTHFTSPLRRYPDILVHRTLAAVLEAEELYLKHQRLGNKVQRREELIRRCFTGIYFEKPAAESKEGKEALLAAALKHGVPGIESLAYVAIYCNDRKLASRRVKDACDRLYMWALLKKKEILLSEARVLGLGPRFMSIYIHKLAIERRIYYDEVEGLMVEWLDATSTLVLSLSPNRRCLRRGSPGRWRALEDVALIVSPCDLKSEQDVSGSSNDEHGAAAYNSELSNSGSSEIEIDPVVFPLTVHVLSTIPVALHAVGGDDGPVDIGARLYTSSYFY
ncbi:DIS3-like exonuclease 2 isoform X2 [Ziziphus jujuba]|uniref:DIS3-like exonuclease 2 n=1 Tax=Ziziphus jujuba TaxID=326968 RepID=A0ABM3INZ5_ZIZJJ|nr:DIS3-like exonuclease 2 isoform X2 [Ziziphus jujuba]